MLILSVNRFICVKKHIFKSIDDALSIKTTIFAADF